MTPRCRTGSARGKAALMLSRLILAAAGLIGIAADAATAQTSGGSPPPAVVAPVEIAMSVVNGDVRCGPPRARLPARNPLELAVVNRAEQPLWFVAPEFFRAADHIDSRGFTLDLVQGGFLVAAGSTVRVLLRTPAAGEYYYLCYQPGSVPRPESSGFLIVVPAAR
jgi:hypothetical protein